MADFAWLRSGPAFAKCTERPSPHILPRPQARGTGGIAGMKTMKLLSLPIVSTCGVAFGSVVVADVTDDGRPDVLTADCLSGNVTAYVNLGSGSFAAGSSTSAGYRPTTVPI